MSNHSSHFRDSPLLTSIVVLLSTCCVQRDNDRFQRAPFVDGEWSDLPTEGMHVSGAWQCRSSCRISNHDVILSIDGEKAQDVKTSYARLGDGERHVIAIWDYQRQRKRHITASFPPANLPQLGLASIVALQSVPEAAKGPRRGTMAPVAHLQGTERSWTLPDDLFGRTYILFDSKPGYFAEGQFPRHAAASFENLDVPFFFVSTSPVDHQITPEVPDDLQKHPLVEAAVTPYLEVGTYGKRGYRVDGYLAGYGPHWSPDITVIDCHGVVRWSYNRLANISIEQAIEQSIRFAGQLEASRKAGDCSDLPVFRR